jgi:hypothetical protein
MLALAIALTDPDLDDAVIPLTGVTVAFWVVVTVALTVRAFRRGWFVVAGRILGSWLIAGGLLYGGASLVPRPSLPPSPPPTTPPPPASVQSTPPAIPGFPPTPRAGGLQGQPALNGLTGGERRYRQP